MKFSFDAKSAINGFENLIAGLEGVLDEALEELALIGQKVAQSKTKGKLKKAIIIQNGVDGWELIANKPYAYYVEHGRGPIKAKPGKPLVFMIGGRKIFTDEVKAAKPKPFMLPARTKIEQVAEQIVHKHIRTLIR